ATGLQKEVVIENALARYEREERDLARERLERVWADEEGGAEAEVEGEENGRVTEEEAPELAPGPREGQREAVQARALLEKAERLVGSIAPQDRGDIEKLMERVRAALADRRWDQLGSASNELADVPFYLEDA